MATPSGPSPTTPTAQVILDSVQEDPLVKVLTAFWMSTWKASKAVALGFTHNIILYKPPVGIVTFLVTFQWFQSRIFQRNFLEVLDLDEFPIKFLNRKRNQRKKAQDIDAADREYDTAGGVQATALLELAEESQIPQLQQLVADSACPPRASRCDCARRLVDTVVEYQTQQPPPPKSTESLEALLELRALDSLLRCVRDEDLLPATDRLRTAQQAWQVQVNTWATSKRQWIKRVALHVIRKPPSLQEWRTQLQQTTDKLQQEYEQLGQVQQLLLRQPNDPKQQQQLITQWNARARELLKNLIIERWSRVDPTKVLVEGQSRTIGDNLQIVSDPSSWSLRHWNCSLALVEHGRERYRLTQQQSAVVASWKMGLNSFTKNLDWYGIPSAFLKIVIANAIHTALVPYWPQIKQTGLNVGTAVWGVVEFRFYRPLKVIVMDLLNRRPRLLDPGQLTNEQESLLNMLRDLGIDVENMSMDAALKEAARLYEKQLKNGAVKNMVFGQMVRLLLIQVQQLKSDLLQAFQSIDELVDANRLNVSLLAAIPAYLLIRWGTRFFYSVFYRLRVRHVNGLHDAHQELTSLLRELERLLILTNQKQMTCAQLGEFVSKEQKYLLLLDYCQPPLATKQVDSIYKDVQDLLPHGDELDAETQLNLLKLIHQKNAELLKSI